MRTRHGQRRRRAGALFQLAAGLALVSAAVAAAFVDQAPPAQTTSAAKPSSYQVRTAPQDAAESNNHADSVYRIRIPRLAVDAPIVAVDIDEEGVLGVPANPAEVGWWSDGPVPGSARGTSILAGHVNTAARGPGAFRSIERLQPGDRIVVEGWGEAITFEVDAIVRYDKGEIPAAAFDQRRAGRLAIVSCSDLDEETGQYRDNLVVYANPATAASTANRPTSEEPTR